MPGRRNDFDSGMPSSSSPVVQTGGQPSLREQCQKAPARLVGALFLCGSLVLGKFVVWDVIQAAQNHADSIEISTKGVVVTAVGILFGIYYLVFGELGKRLISKESNGGKIPAVGWVVILAIVGLGFLANYLIRMQLQQLGYGVGSF
jgi:hypothetical protein